MYKCYDCEEVFDEPERFYNTLTDTFYSGCPHCSKYYKEVIECKCCNKLVPLDEMYDDDICNDCQEEKFINGK